MARRNETRPDPWTLPGLGADGPDPALQDKLHLFGQFVGDWDIDRRWIGPDGSEHRNRGRVYFRWILGGRAVQDIFSTIKGDPPREIPAGTTIRFYDTKTDAWTSLFIAPAQGVLQRFSVRESGDEIVLSTTNDAGRPEHWIFSEITPTAFRWRAEESHDEGKTWKLTEEMRMRRRTVHDGRPVTPGSPSPGSSGPRAARAGGTGPRGT